MQRLSSNDVRVRIGTHKERTTNIESCSFPQLVLTTRLVHKSIAGLLCSRSLLARVGEDATAYFDGGMHQSNRPNGLQSARDPPLKAMPAHWLKSDRFARGG